MESERDGAWSVLVHPAQRVLKLLDGQHNNARTCERMCMLARTGAHARARAKGTQICTQIHTLPCMRARTRAPHTAPHPARRDSCNYSFSGIKTQAGMVVESERLRLGLLGPSTAGVAAASVSVGEGSSEGPAGSAQGAAAPQSAAEEEFDMWVWKWTQSMGARGGSQTGRHEVDGDRWLGCACLHVYAHMKS